ncbi:MAG: lysylphosphatidylglycerol synthase domain-containing protein [bacterium]|nr:lysylphosphatidylglycerol synthase domain-containing protein [bacterium]
MSRLERLKPFLKVLRIAYLVGLAVLIGWIVRSEWSDVVQLVVGARPGLIAASLAASFGLILVGAWFWVVSLRTQGYRAPPLQVLNKATHATSRSLLARYVPGSVWFAVGRVGLLRAAGLPIGPLSATAVLEMATSLTVVLICGLGVLSLSGGIPGGATWMIVLALALIAATSPAIGGRVVAWWAARKGVVFSLTWRGYLQLVGINLVFWGWSALTFLLYLRSFPVADPYRTTLVVGGFLLTWGIGFLAPFAPQGIGVFEVGMATVLRAEEVVGMAVVLGGYRLVLLARDLIATSVAEFIATRTTLRGSARKEWQQALGPVGGTDPDP